MGQLFTIGHSNHPAEHFILLLKQHGIEVLADVRTRPVSGYCPHFSAPQIERLVKDAGARYLFLGETLGGQPRDSGLYDERGHALYWKMSDTPEFADGIGRLLKGIQNFRVAIMCSEENPSICHRRLLVTKVLHARGVGVTHIRGDGRVETETQILQAEEAARPQLDFLAGFDEEAEKTAWKSIQSGLREKALGSSSTPYEEPI
ncbi:hypothetical protein BH09SUM1_BH09SUM1_15960 [soil metagenome]